MIIIAEIDAFIFIKILEHVQIGEVIANHCDDKLFVSREIVGLVGHIFLVFRRIFHHGVEFFHHILMVVCPVDFQRSLLFLEILIILNRIQNAVVDIFQIWMQIFVCRNVFMFVFCNFIICKAFGFNEKRQLPDEQFIELVDAFQQVFDAVVDFILT